MNITFYVKFSASKTKIGISFQITKNLNSRINHKYNLIISHYSIYYRTKQEFFKIKIKKLKTKKLGVNFGSSVTKI